MSDIKIYIDPSFSESEELAKLIKKSLDEFSTIDYKETKVKKPEGELFPGIEQVVEFIIEHHDKLIEASIAIINLVSRLVSKKKIAKEKGKKKNPTPVIIIVKENKLKFPSASSTQEKFLKEIKKENKPGGK